MLGPRWATLCDTETLLSSSSDNEGTLPRRDDGSCVFLDEQNHCVLHALMGEELKPQVCQDFPYIYRLSPFGLFFGLSFTCPSVRTNKGELVEQNKDQLAQNACRAYRCETIQDPVTLDPRYLCSWASYEQIETSLLHLMEKTEVPLDQRLVACHSLLGMLRLWLDMRMGQPRDPLERRLASAELISDFLSTNERKEFREPLRIAAKPRGQRASRRCFLALVVGCAASMWEKGKPVGAAWGLVRNYIQAALRLGQLRIPPLERHISYRILEVAPFSLSGEAEQLLRRYALMTIFRKDLVAGPLDLRRQWDLVLLRLALAGIYATALANSQARSADPRIEQWSQALEIVETYYGHHSRLFELIESFPRLASVLDSFFALRTYPDTVLGRFKK